MASELTKHLTPIKEGLRDLAQRSTDIEERMDQATLRTDTHKWAIEELRDQVRELEEAQEDLNNRSRRSNIRIRGIPESVEIPPSVNSSVAYSPAELLLDRARDTPSRLRDTRFTSTTTWPPAPCANRGNCGP
ncbi:Hypothetical predicted protein [Pelobates cultripes]|uniref:Uncharacterized protein n=1 Tax=Pelobates cultripes TaxID=61616 RepID=A0AAD1WKP1_PELCU|nr:Hypothetical predicted protein [Pelobates cultripes]